MAEQEQKTEPTYIEVVKIDLNGDPYMDEFTSEKPGKLESLVLKRMASDIEAEYPNQYDTDSKLNLYNRVPNFKSVFFHFWQILGIDDEKTAIEKYCNLENLESWLKQYIEGMVKEQNPTDALNTILRIKNNLGDIISYSYDENRNLIINVNIGRAKITNPDPTINGQTDREVG